MRWAGILVALLLAYSYAGSWITSGGLETTRPYVYRQLVPLLAGLLQGVGLSLGWAVVLIQLACAAGFAVVSYHLYRAFHER